MKICRYCNTRVEAVWLEDYFYLKCDCMKLNKFIKQYLDLSFNQLEKKFHFYPNICYSDHINEGAKITIIESNNCLTCYEYINTILNNHCSKIYCAINFPKSSYFPNDFICVYIIVEDRVSTVILPYDAQTGKRFKPLYKTYANALMLQQYNSVISQIRYKEKNKKA